MRGGISECVGSFGIFAFGPSALANIQTHPATPFDVQRNGIVISEGGAMYVLERMDAAQARGAPILAEITGYAMNSDARDFVLPHGPRQAECMELALQRAGLRPQDISLINTHATGTRSGDVEECRAIRSLFTDCPDLCCNNTKSHIGHAMGAAGVLELAGNPGLVHRQADPAHNQLKTS